MGAPCHGICGTVFFIVIQEGIDMGKHFQPEVQKAVELIWMRYDKESAEKGQELLRLAAAGGDADAWGLLARTYMGDDELAVWEGSGLPVDEVQADEYLKWSISNGSALGVLCALEHRNLYPSELKAVLSIWGSTEKVLEVAKEYEDEPMGAHLLGRCYAIGAVFALLGRWDEDTKENKVRLALPYLEKALDGGLALSFDAYQDGAEILYENTGDLNKKEKALVLEGRFCRAGVPHVLYMRGQRLYEREEYKHSFQVYGEAGEKGHKEATYNMGFMCRYGIGTEKDTDKALQYLLPLAEQGHVPSMGQVAEIYFWGELGERNLESAYLWCEKLLDRVAELVHLHPNGGVYRYDTILPLMCYCKYFGQGTVIDREMAVRSIMLENKIEENENKLPEYKQALLYGLMAEIYANGSGGIDKDKKKSKYYWQKAKKYEDYDKWLGDLEWDKSPDAFGSRFAWAIFGRREEEKTTLTDVESIRDWQEQRIKQAQLSWKGRQPWCLKVKREDESETGFRFYKENELEQALELLWQGVYLEVTLEEENGDFLVLWADEEKFSLFAQIKDHCSRLEAKDEDMALSIFKAWYKGEGLTGDGWQDDEWGNARAKWNELLLRAEECRKCGDKEGRMANFKAAADTGCGRAMIYIGQELAEAGDAKGASTWFLNATLTEEPQDKALSWECLGRLYMENPEEKGMEARYYLQKAVDMGLVSALLPLGKCYEKGIGGVKNLQEAISCYDEAIKYGNPAAMAARAALYKQADGQWENLNDAVELLEKALKYEEHFEGRQEALILLAEAYLAEGIDEKREMARYILVKEARIGNHEAAYRLAHLYEDEGEGEQYREILCHTAAEGYEPAKEELKRVYAGSSWSECL